MTFVQAVFSFHAIFCFFYGCGTFFNPELTVAMDLAREYRVTNPQMMKMFLVTDKRII